MTGTRAKSILLKVVVAFESKKLRGVFVVLCFAERLLGEWLEGQFTMISQAPKNLIHSPSSEIGPNEEEKNDHWQTESQVDPQIVNRLSKKEL